jgi:hypothetical protein
MSWMNPPWAGGGAKPKPSFNPLKNIVPARNTPARGEAQATSNAGRGLAASQARYAGMGRTMSPVTQNLPSPGDSGDDGSGGQVVYGTQTVDNPAPFNIAEVPVETLRTTPEYMARERALAAAMEMFGAKQRTDKDRFEEDYGKSLSELGYDPTDKSWDQGQLMSSGQRVTTAGKAFNALRNDFAARGMLQSGAYQAQRNLTQQQLADQLTATEGRRTRFLEDQSAALTAQEQQNEQARQQALDEARQAILARMGMGG